MAISVTEILGTDSLSGSRLVINDNFNVLASEINSMEVYISPSAGTITNLNNLSSEALRVGLSTILLDINASTFDILTNVKMTGNLNMTGAGIFRNDTNIQTLDSVFAGGNPISVGTSTAIPAYTMNRVGNTTAAAIDIILYNGSIGQEILFIYTEGSGDVDISGFNSNLVLPGATTSPNKLTLNAIGQSVHLLAIDNGQGQAVWFLVGGQGYVIA